MPTLKYISYLITSVFVGWLVGLFVDVFANLLVNVSFVSSHPVTGCNGGCAAGGSAARRRRFARQAEVAPYERFFMF